MIKRIIYYFFFAAYVIWTIVALGYDYNKYVFIHEVAEVEQMGSINLAPDPDTVFFVDFLMFFSLLLGAGLFAFGRLLFKGKERLRIVSVISVFVFLDVFKFIFFRP